MSHRFTVVCENTVCNSTKLIGEHGLSMLIEGEDSTLFDTGQGFGILHNMSELGIDPVSIERIVLSHGHYDHTGGLDRILEKIKRPVKVYAHKDLATERFSIRGEKERSIGLPGPIELYEDLGAVFQPLDSFKKIGPGLFVLTNLQIDHGNDSPDSALVVKQGDEYFQDPFMDDLSLLVETERGPVIILGCAHAGVPLIFREMSRESGHRSFYAVLGGMHLAHASKSVVEEVISTFRDFKLEVIAPAHCTGIEVTGLLMSVFGDRVVPACAGKRYEW